MDHDLLAHVPDEELLVTVRRLTARSNVALANLLAHLGEVERRGIHRARACASLYTYCVYELRMSEDAAYRRSRAARLVRRYPDLREAIAKGEIHLTGALMIGPHLGGERHGEVLERARYKSKRELSRLIAEIDPRPPVPSLVEPLGPAPAGRATHSAHVESMMGPVRELPEGARPADWIVESEISTDEVSTTELHAAEATATGVPSDGVPAAEVHAMQVPAAEAHAGQIPATEARPANGASLPVTRRPLQYRLQFTASQRYVDLLEEAIALLGHERPRPGLPDVHLRALELLVMKLRKERRGGSDAVNLNAAESCTAPARPSRPVHHEPDTAGDAPARPSRPVHHEPDTAGDAPARLSRPVHHEPDTDCAPPATPARPVRSPDADADAPARVTEPPGGGSRGRYVSRSVRRAVWDRDGARCAYVDDRGVRCREISKLELHHRKAFALGGPNTTENLELRCTSHNALAAEEDFGQEFLDRVRPRVLRIEA